MTPTVVEEAAERAEVRTRRLVVKSRREGIMPERDFCDQIGVCVSGKWV